jgi:hypothetical protein
MTYTVTNLTTLSTLRWQTLAPGEPSAGSFPRLHMTEFERKQFKVMERLGVKVLRPGRKNCELEIVG